MKTLVERMFDAFVLRIKAHVGDDEENIIGIHDLQGLEYTIEFAYHDTIMLFLSYADHKEKFITAVPKIYYGQQQKVPLNITLFDHEALSVFQQLLVNNIVKCDGRVQIKELSEKIEP